MDSTPCACGGMGDDPHCMYCCQHLSPGNERAWREDLARLFDENPEQGHED